MTETYQTGFENGQMQKRDSAASTNLATNHALFNESNGDGKSKVTKLTHANTAMLDAEIQQITANTPAGGAPSSSVMSVGRKTPKVRAGGHHGKNRKKERAAH